MVCFGESLTVVTLVGLVLVCVGVVLLTLVEEDIWPEAWDATLWQGDGASDSESSSDSVSVNGSEKNASVA